MFHLHTHIDASPASRRRAVLLFATSLTFVTENRHASNAPNEREGSCFVSGWLCGGGGGAFLAMRWNGGKLRTVNVSVPTTKRSSEVAALLQLTSRGERRRELSVSEWCPFASAVVILWPRWQFDCSSHPLLYPAFLVVFNQWPPVLLERLPGCLTLRAAPWRPLLAMTSVLSPPYKKKTAAFQSALRRPAAC